MHEFVDDDAGVDASVAQGDNLAAAGATHAAAAAGTLDYPDVAGLVRARNEPERSKLLQHTCSID